MESIWPLLPSLVPDGLSVLGRALLAIAKVCGSLSVNHGQSGEQLQLPAARALSTGELSRYIVRVTVYLKLVLEMKRYPHCSVSDPILLKNEIKHYAKGVTSNVATV